MTVPDPADIYTTQQLNRLLQAWPHLRDRTGSAAFDRALPKKHKGDTPTSRAELRLAVCADLARALDALARAYPAHGKPGRDLRLMVLKVVVQGEPVKHVATILGCPRGHVRESVEGGIGWMASYLNDPLFRANADADAAEREAIARRQTSGGRDAA